MNPFTRSGLPAEPICEIRRKHDPRPSGENRPNRYMGSPPIIRGPTLARNQNRPSTATNFFTQSETASDHFPMHPLRLGLTARERSGWTADDLGARLRGGRGKKDYSRIIADPVAKWYLWGKYRIPLGNPLFPSNLWWIGSVKAQSEKWIGLRPPRELEGSDAPDPLGETETEAARREIRCGRKPDARLGRWPTWERPRCARKWVRDAEIKYRVFKICEGWVGGQEKSINQKGLRAASPKRRDGQEQGENSLIADLRDAQTLFVPTSRASITSERRFAHRTASAQTTMGAVRPENPNRARRVWMRAGKMQDGSAGMESQRKMQVQTLRWRAQKRNSVANVACEVLEFRSRAEAPSEDRRQHRPGNQEKSINQKGLRAASPKRRDGQEQGDAVFLVHVAVGLIFPGRSRRLGTCHVPARPCQLQRPTSVSTLEGESHTGDHPDFDDDYVLPDLAVPCQNDPVRLRQPYGLLALPDAVFGCQPAGLSWLTQVARQFGQTNGNG
ncbi:hypothetical protein GGX14DRAFT_405215 [Mycena pura]|uniref:Uncharacterized protein n=1 Tax=Mycena pura TaxID=153505 RepID=A0AAD6UW58_9AGAR|nr:hypothetical protein GGX14DRAFT_405215 [Mycena pura]